MNKPLFWRVMERARGLRQKIILAWCKTCDWNRTSLCGGVLQSVKARGGKWLMKSEFQMNHLEDRIEIHVSLAPRRATTVPHIHPAQVFHSPRPCSRQIAQNHYQFIS